MYHLFTDRLILRPFQVSDAPQILELNSDDEVMRYTGDAPFVDEKAALDFIEEYISTQGPYQSTGMGRLAVIHKQTEDFLGWCGLKLHVSSKKVDIGYRFMKKYWGNGYATESALVTLNHAFNHHKCERVVAHIHESNVPSQKVAERIGMTLDHRFLWEGKEPARCYVINKSK